MPRRPLSLLLLPLFLVLFAPAAAAQEDEEVNCDSLCMLPQEPPPQCICRITGGTGSGSGGGGQRLDTIEPHWGPPGSAHPMVMEIVESYEARIATVNDYIVVARVGGGLPVVLYYEKVMVDYPGRSEHPIMQLVTQGEMNRRQGASAGGPTPEQLLEGIGAAAPALSGLLGTLPTDGLPQEVRSQMDRIRMGLAFLPFAMEGIMDGPEDETEAYGNDVFWTPDFLMLMAYVARIAETIEVDGSVIDVLVVSNADLDFSQLTDLEVKRITLWTVRTGQHRVPLRMKIDAYDGIQPMQLDRRWNGRAWVGPMNEAYTIEDIMNEGHRAVTRIDQILINQGLPDSAEIARLIRQSSGSGE